MQSNNKVFLFVYFYVREWLKFSFLCQEFDVQHSQSEGF